LKEISRQEKDLLIKKDIIKQYTYKTPIYSDNGRYMYDEVKTVYQDLIIMNSGKSGKQTYLTKDSTVESLRNGLFNK
jgi:hypothetical protein